MIIYGAMYNFNPQEENDDLISLHKTKEGADKVVKNHKQLELNRHSKYCSSMNQECTCDYMLNKEWNVAEYELLD